MPSAPVRESLRTLISFTRDLVGEGDSDTSALSDNQIQTALDVTHERVRYERLQYVPTIAPGGAVEYRDFEAEGHLDDSPQLLDASYNVIPADDFDLFDPFVGRFTLKTSRSTGIYLVGDRYDPFAAAADLLTSMAARSKSAVDFAEVGLSIKASQTAPQMLSLASEYRRKARIRSIEFGRSDVR
jgi:hypothetical protein